MNLAEFEAIFRLQNLNPIYKSSSSSFCSHSASSFLSSKPLLHFDFFQLTLRQIDNQGVAIWRLFICLFCTYCWDLKCLFVFKTMGVLRVWQSGVLFLISGVFRFVCILSVFACVQCFHVWLPKGTASVVEVLLYHYFATQWSCGSSFHLLCLHWDACLTWHKDYEEYGMQYSIWKPAAHVFLCLMLSPVCVASGWFCSKQLCQPWRGLLLLL